MVVTSLHRYNHFYVSKILADYTRYNNLYFHNMIQKEPITYGTFVQYLHSIISVYTFLTLAVF